jgi:uncharacterized hydrophobic protein (TIGR00271 family)
MENSMSAATLKSTHLQQWLQIESQHKPEVYAQICNTVDLSNLNYWLEIIFSAGIATLGLVLNSPAVIIGAMLISPLMDPIMATGLAFAAGDLYLAGKALFSLLASIALAVAFSAFIVWLLPFHAVTSEILSRTNPTLLDLGVALFSGLAGSVAVCKYSSGVTTLPGVAVAVALMPPLCTVGFGLGNGVNIRVMGGAGLLFLTNLVAIVASAFVVFLLIGMNAAEVRAEMEHSKKGEILIKKLSHGRLLRALFNGARLRWRILILVVVLGAIAFPLQKAFRQVASEAIARGAVQDVVKRLLPPGTLVSQQVEVGRQNLVVRIIATRVIPNEKIQQAERDIERRCGRNVSLSISSIANQDELTELMQKISTSPQPNPVPSEKSFSEVHRAVIARIQPILNSVWPQEAPLKNFDVSFSPSGIVINVQYESTRELDQISQGIILRELQEKLISPDITLSAKRIPPHKIATRKVRRLKQQSVTHGEQNSL